MDAKERVEAASNFLLQSPPGEINDVLNGVRNIISDDDSLQDGIQSTLREYNLEQFITVDVPGAQHQTLISRAAIVSTEEGAVERFLDPRSKTSFLFDHIGLDASDPQPHEPNAESEEFRSALETATQTYLAAHFVEGVAAVFASPDAPNKFTIQVVSNKYNPNNFWSGRWRSEYTVDLNDNTINGKIWLNVHYYEQGNVQLNTTHNITIALPPAIVTSAPPAAASKILALIDFEETKYQTSLNDTYSEMGEKTFKALRRALPMTRQKLDWDKVLGYKIGQEIQGSKGLP
ncbi:F-actin-capping protein subunit alpha [Schizophyllum commune]